MLNLIDDFSAPCFFYWNNLGSQEPKYESQMMEIQDAFLTKLRTVWFICFRQKFEHSYIEIYFVRISYLVQNIFEDQMNYVLINENIGK